MMMTSRTCLPTWLSLLLVGVAVTTAFAPPAPLINQGRPSALSRRGATPNSPFKTSLKATPLSEGDQVMLVGPGFLQLVVARACKAVGLRPIVVAPQKKLDSFFSTLLLDKDIQSDSTIGMPEVGEPQFGNIAAVVFCAEDAILPESIVQSVLSYKDQGQSAFTEGNLKRVICCAPISNKVTEEKAPGWIPIFGKSQEKTTEAWKKFVYAYKRHPSSDVLIRHGSLLGGSTDGPEFLEELGLEQDMYKMSLEQYRDLKERAFDRFRLGVQILEGDTVNPQPPNQEKMEKEGITSDELRESFRVVGGYPQVDRANRHSVAQAVVQTLLRGDEVPKEFTVLSKSVSELPSRDEWDELFRNPSPAAWPDPYAFDPAAYGIEVSK